MNIFIAIFSHINFSLQFSVSFSLQFSATLINLAQNGQFFTKIRHIR